MSSNFNLDPTTIEGVQLIRLITEVVDECDEQLGVGECEAFLNNMVNNRPDVPSLPLAHAKKSNQEILISLPLSLPSTQIKERLKKTIWLEKDITDPLLLADKPTYVPDTRTETQLKYPEFFPALQANNDD